MTSYEELLERAARAAYERTKELAPQYYNESDLKRYIEWNDLSDAWRDNYISTIKVGLAEVYRTLETVTPEMWASLHDKFDSDRSQEEDWLCMLGASPLSPSNEPKP